MQGLAGITLDKAVSNTLGLYCMTNNDCPGEIVYDKSTKRVSIEWDAEKHKQYYHTSRKALQEAVSGLGGRPVINPKWSNQLGDSVVTRHPLGGCCMGNTGLNGAVNDRGQLFIGMYFLLYFIYLKLKNIVENYIY